MNRNRTPPSVRSPHFRPSSPAGGSLLVWDQDPLSLLATAGALHTAGHRCVCARNASAVVQATTPTAGGEAPSALIIDVGNDAGAALKTLAQVREIHGNENLPAVLVATTDWAGLEKKVEAIEAPTRCLFKPIDPQSLIAVVDSLLWMPTLEQAHRRRGSRPAKSGWVTL